MAKTYYVYTHSRADTGEVFYVGCATKHYAKRGRNIYSRAYDTGLRTKAWFDVRDVAGGISVALVLETSDRVAAFSLERKLIALHGRADLGRGQLVNQTDGGAGAGGQIGTPESRRKKSEGKIGALNPMYGKTGAAHPMSRRVISNGVEFPSVQSAADALGVNMKTLYNMLSGHRPNRLGVRFA